MDPLRDGRDGLSLLLLLARTNPADFDPESVIGHEHAVHPVDAIHPVDPDSVLHAVHPVHPVDPDVDADVPTPGGSHPRLDQEGRWRRLWHL